MQLLLNIDMYVFFRVYFAGELPILAVSAYLNRLMVSFDNQKQKTRLHKNNL